jgi:hypothetical protein
VVGAVGVVVHEGGVELHDLEPLLYVKESKEQSRLGCAIGIELHETMDGRTVTYHHILDTQLIHHVCK